MQIYFKVISIQFWHTNKNIYTYLAWTNNLNTNRFRMNFAFQCVCVLIFENVGKTSTHQQKTPRYFPRVFFLPASPDGGLDSSARGNRRCRSESDHGDPVDPSKGTPPPSPGNNIWNVLNWILDVLYMACQGKSHYLLFVESWLFVPKHPVPCSTWRMLSGLPVSFLLKGSVETYNM